VVEQSAVKGGVSQTVERRKYTDRREYLIEAVKKRRRKIREKAIHYLGGKCQICGYGKCAEALEFHHLDGSSKDFGISSRGHARSWERVRSELEKCMLLCANCHREVHAKSQRSGESQDGKSGEFREALTLYTTKELVTLSEAC
jgi:5-methylcytosine-specific restriction endonuclease McrA